MRYELPSSRDIQRWHLVRKKIDAGADGPDALWDLLSSSGPLAVHRHVARRVDGDIPTHSQKVAMYERFLGRLRRVGELAAELAPTLIEV